MSGVMIGFDERLKAGVAESRREGLVWVGDPALAGCLRQRYPRTSRGGGIGLYRTEAYEHGRKAGREIVLHRPVHGSSETGRLLGPAAMTCPPQQVEAAACSATAARSGRRRNGGTRMPLVTTWQRRPSASGYLPVVQATPTPCRAKPTRPPTTALLESRDLPLDAMLR